MFRNYLTIAWRNLLRDGLTALVNIAGLTLGLSAFIFINEYVLFEKSYDRQFEHSEQIYRVSVIELIDGLIEDTKDAMTFQPAAAALAAEIPGIVDHTTTYKFGEKVFRIDDKVFREYGVVSAETSFLRMFDYKVLQGSRKDMLKGANSLVLTKSKAEEFFPDGDAIGKSVEMLGKQDPFVITGIIEDPTPNTHYKFDILISDPTIVNKFDYNSWGFNTYYGYVQLAENVTAQDIAPKVISLSKKFVDNEGSTQLILNSISDIHLKSDFTFEPEVTGNSDSLRFLTIIAYFILFIAWVNYVNLTTAKSVERAKEVGLRKVIGARRNQLIGQFILEALLVNSVSIIIAIGLVQLLTPSFNLLIGTEIILSVWQSQSFLFNLAIFFILGTVIAGFYPAFVLSGFRPVNVLKGKFYNSKQGVILRKSLVVFQFAASLLLIAGTLIVNKQMRFVNSVDKGIEIDHVIGLRLPHNTAEEYLVSQSFLKTVRDNSAILGSAATSRLPGGNGWDIDSSTKIRIIGVSEPDERTTYIQTVDDQFLTTVEASFLKGRNFDFSIPSDSRAIIVNESFLKKFNLEDPLEMVGEKITLGDSEETDLYEIIGIIKDFNRTTLKEAVEPTIYYRGPFDHYNMRGIIRFAPSRYQEGIETVRAHWVNLFPDYPFDFEFLDERFEGLYVNDYRFSKVFTIFSALAMTIAILGLYGLASLMAIQRTKEIGVRKVLGASVASIIGLFYKDFALLLIVAALIGIPGAYFALSGWLESYAFRINFPWLLPGIALLAVSGIALLTIGIQTIKVAEKNPSNTLKYE